MKPRSNMAPEMLADNAVLKVREQGWEVRRCRVVHYREGYDVYGARPSPIGNPHSEGTRAENIAAFEATFASDSAEGRWMLAWVVQGEGQEGGQVMRCQHCHAEAHNGHECDVSVLKVALANERYAAGECRKVVVEWAGKHGHDRRHYHPELFGYLCAVLGLPGPSGDLLPRVEFESGCGRYQDEVYATTGKETEPCGRTY